MTMTQIPQPLDDLHAEMLRHVNEAIGRLTFGAGTAEPPAAQAEPPPRPAFRRIVVGYDGSAGGRQALEWAGHLGTLHQATVLVASVAPPPVVPAATSTGLWMNVQATYRDAEDALRKASDGAAALLREHGVRSDAITVMGRPARELVEIARTNAADLVIVGAHGGGALSRVLLGSVANAVVHRAAASVLVARTRPPVHRVLAPVDGSRASHRATAAALRYAGATDAFLVVQHVLEREDAPTLPPEGHLKRVVERMHLPRSPRVRYVLDVGRPAARIVEKASAEGCDLIVMGSRGLGRVEEALVGSVSHRVAHAAEASVLLTREPRHVA